MPSNQQPYHHGNLRPALLRAAVQVIEEVGPAAMSMREVARRAGVSHTSAMYHFGDKAGLLTAVATEASDLLGAALREAQETHHDFLEVGVAYVRFAVTHRAHFEVLYRPELYHRDDPDFQRAKARTDLSLYGTDHKDAKQLAAGVAAWAFVHGLATLWLNGNIPEQLGDDPEKITRLVASHLGGPRPRPTDSKVAGSN